MAAQLNKAFQAEESPSVIYCISMQWFREWEAFVKGKDNGEWSMRLAHRLQESHQASDLPGVLGEWGALGLWLPSRF